MRTDTVKEPTVVLMTTAHPAKSSRPLRERAAIDVDIIGRLVEEQHIAFFLEAESQVKTVALTTGEHAAKLFLVGSGEVEARQVGTRVDVASAHTDEVVAAGDYLIDALVGSMSLCCWST